MPSSYECDDDDNCGDNSDEQGCSMYKIYITYSYVTL